MRHDKLGLQLELLLLLTENRQWTVEQICQKLHIQKRNLYYYLDFFRGADFNIVKHGAYYSISRDSKFISRLCDIVKFSEKTEEYIAAALAPAEVVSVTLTGERACRVQVEPEHLSLAIGKEGQNARLAARLTGCKIDIKAE